MPPNIFIDRSHCAEDFFSHSLAYILNLFPSLGDGLANRIAVLAGKRADYFGQFQACDFIADEFPRGHRASRPDLRLVCSARTIYFENKLDSPLSVGQMQRHAELIQQNSTDHLLFVSNISHRSPDLRSIPRYIYPLGQDHYLWVDLLTALESRHRKGSLAARILGDFHAALKLHGMVGRTIKGATGSLYTSGSEASHLALSQLSQELRKLGFSVARKQARENTLRVYPSRHAEYPLLNPGFFATAGWLDSNLDHECLVITVLSKSRALRLDRRLCQFSSRSDCRFIPDPFQQYNYFCHGYFVLPVRFIGKRGSNNIDFPSLAGPLSRILKHLTSSR